MSVEIAPAWIPEILAEAEEKAALIASFAQRYHFDVNDGVLVPAVSWPCGEGQWEELEAAAEARTLPEAQVLAYDVHLMAADPARMGELFARAGAASIVAQIEAFDNEDEIRETLHTWRELGTKEVGLAILLDTPLSKLVPVADEIDIVQVMSIAKIGFQKQSFQESAIARVREIREKWPAIRITVDGGVSAANAKELADAGAARLVVGSAIMGKPDPKAAYAEILGLVSA